MYVSWFSNHLLCAKHGGFLPVFTAGVHGSAYVVGSHLNDHCAGSVCVRGPVCKCKLCTLPESFHTTWNYLTSRAGEGYTSVPPSLSTESQFSALQILLLSLLSPHAIHLLQVFKIKLTKSVLTLLAANWRKWYHAIFPEELIDEAVIFYAQFFPHTPLIAGVWHKLPRRHKSHTSGTKFSLVLNSLTVYIYRFLHLWRLECCFPSFVWRGDLCTSCFCMHTKEFLIML